MNPSYRSTAFSGFAVALGLCLILPLLNYLRDAPIADFSSEWMSTVAFAVAVVFLLRVVPRWQPLNLTLLLPPFALAAVLLVHVALGTFAYFYDWAIWSAYLTVFVLAVLVGQAARAGGLVDETVRRIAWAVILTGVVNSGLQLTQVFGFDLQLYPFVVPLIARSACRVYGNVAQANQASLVAWLSIAAVLYLAGTHRMPLRIGTLLITLLLFSSALTVSRMAWLFLGIAAALVLFLRAWPAPSGRARWFIVSMLGFGFVLASIAVGELLPFAQPGCATALERFGDSSEPGTVIRSELWRLAIQIWSMSPWIGTGAGSFLPKAYELAPHDRHLPLDAYAHNSGLQILAEFGLIGAGVVAAMFLLWLVSLYRHRHQLGAADAIVLAWLGVIGVHSMLEFPLWYMYFLLLFGLLLGMLIRPEWNLSVRRAPMVATLGSMVAVVMIGSIIVLQEYRKLERAHVMVTMKIEMKAVSTPQVISRILEVADQVHLYRPYVEHLLSLIVPLTRDSLEEKIRNSDRLLHRFPQISTMAQRATLAVLAGDLETARYHLRRLFVFYPRESVEVVGQMREIIAHRPDELGALGRLLDEEQARAPKPRW